MPVHYPSSVANMEVAKSITGKTTHTSMLLQLTVYHCMSQDAKSPGGGVGIDSTAGYVSNTAHTLLSASIFLVSDRLAQLLLRTVRYCASARCDCLIMKTCMHAQASPHMHMIRYVTS